jgi:histone H3/H4
MAKRPRPPPERAVFVKSKVREYIKSKGCNTSGDLLDGDMLNDLIVDILEKAIKRAKANGRKTVKQKDL